MRIGKRVIALILILSVFTLYAVLSVTAAGKDDSSVYATNGYGKRYLGVDDTEWRIAFTAADGSNSGFYRYHDIRINEDSVFDIRDLVRLKKNVVGGVESDIDCDGETTRTDILLCQSVLLGMPDVEID